MATNPSPTAVNVGALNNCACCVGIEQETPQTTVNRPGLTAIAYRVGTHAQFEASLLARLHSSRQVALKALTTRGDDDFTIALLDAFSTVADVLTFYTERVANEAYLRTAVERRSVLELAQLIGYELRPGVAASTCLAFTVDPAQGALGTALVPPTTAGVVPEPAPTITVPVGTKVQSVPGPNEQPQTFETIERINARAEWNTISPRLTQPQQIVTTSQSFILTRAINTIKNGDRVLIMDGSGGVTVQTVLNVAITTDPTSADPNASTTEIDVAPLASGAIGYYPASYTSPAGLTQGSISDFPAGTALTSAVVQQIVSREWESDTLLALAGVQDWPVDQLATEINAQIAQSATTPDAGIWVFHQRVTAFGYNAPLWDSLQPGLRYEGVFSIADTTTTPPGTINFAVPAPYGTSWEGLDLAYYGGCSGGACALYLDSNYPDIVASSWIALVSPGVATAAVQVTSNTDTTYSAFTLSAKVSMLTVPQSSPLSAFPIRGTTILCQSELLPLAEVPILDLVQGNVITLGRAYLGLTAGSRVVIMGERSDLSGVTVAELRTLQEVVLQNGFTVITLDSSLDYCYVRATVQINANVALSTNGETVQEILGSGDGSQTFQSFVLQQSPLTYISADTLSGTESTLEVRVDDLLWEEVAYFYGHGPEEHIYITRQDDSANTTVTFGDGITGSRLPSGQQNIKATYRRGIGTGGLVRANQLSLMLTRPLGINAANNPQAATGAADPENLDDARTNATLTIMTLGRIVSLQDYQDFARAYAGIDKALATWTWSGQQRIVLLTVAGVDGATVDPSSELYQNLTSSISLASEPFVNVLLKSYGPLYFRVGGTVTVDPDYLLADVQANVEDALRTAFSFDSRDFGQPVHLSDVITTIQNVIGVLDVDITQLWRSDQPAGLATDIAAGMPQLNDGTFAPAQLLTLDARPLDLEVTQ
ncbi:MAG TPA: putative baseplate assembly protein [Candidatus Sulfotelmatobacter sp.]|nr:putative baseplate assembly protein [Candidatus Sulfotelmatobacter sp.]